VVIRDDGRALPLRSGPRLSLQGGSNEPEAWFGIYWSLCHRRRPIGSAGPGIQTNRCNGGRPVPGDGGDWATADLLQRAGERGDGVGVELGAGAALCRWTGLADRAARRSVDRADALPSMKPAQEDLETSVKNLGSHHRKRLGARARWTGAVAQPAATRPGQLGAERQRPARRRLDPGGHTGRERTWCTVVRDDARRRRGRGRARRALGCAATAPCVQAAPALRGPGSAGLDGHGPAARTGLELAPCWVIAISGAAEPARCGCGRAGPRHLWADAGVRRGSIDGAPRAHPATAANARSSSRRAGGRPQGGSRRCRRDRLRRRRSSRVPHMRGCRSRERADASCAWRHATRGGRP
jgi:hypothetical protein